MNIWKYEFDVEETVFLEVIVSELNLHMNLSKMIIIVSWITLINIVRNQHRASQYECHLTRR